MVADWPYRFALESLWTPAGVGYGPYRLTLRNLGSKPVSDFRLGISGPLHVNPASAVTNGRVVTQLANYAELAPPSGFTLDVGAAWALEIAQLDFPLRHWTDGVVGSFVILADGQAIPVLTEPVRQADDQPHRSGTQGLRASATSPISVIPWPNGVTVAGRRSVPPGLDVDPGPTADAFRELTQLLFPGEGLARPAHEGGLPVHLTTNASLAPEAYRLSLTPEGAGLAAHGPSGHFYGLITLGQMLRGARLDPRHLDFPELATIEDAPATGFRGCHLDTARRFYGVNEIERFLALLAWNKLNRFHWHLSDDEAWRVEIDSYPRLTKTGAWRGHGLALPPLLGTGPEPAGGFYSKDDIRHLVALAGRFGIEVIPEIDVPGHCYALLAAVPGLSDPGENGQYESIQNFPSNCLNPAVEAVYPVLETIFSEMIELFPSRWFHIGADEVPAGAWASSPLANKMREKLGAGTAPLQASFLKRIQAFLKSKGRITGAWEEASHGGGIDAASCYLVNWVSVEGGRHLADQGYRVVVAPAQAYYLDMALTLDFHEPGAGWAGSSTIENSYRFDPVAGWSAEEKSRFDGVQACIWSEPMGERAVFDRLVFPRLSAVAETGWTAPANKDFARFAGLCRFMPNLYGCREASP